MSNNSKPRICAFAICATGERHLKARDRVVKQLKWYVPGVDIVDIDMNEAKLLLPNVPASHLIYFSRLAIPLMTQFKSYERVVYMDVDVDIRSGKFAGILSEETSEEGLAAVADIWQGKYHSHLKEHFPDYAAATYFNAGVTVFDLDKINKQKYADTLHAALEYNTKKPLRWRDQDILNAFFHARELDVRYNYIARRGRAEEVNPYLIHYAGGHGELWKLLAEEARDMNEKQSSVFFVARPKRGNVVGWIRQYFNAGDGSPLIMIGDNSWTGEEMDYCKAAVEFCGGVFIDGNGREVSDADIRQTLNELKIVRWRHVESDVDIQGKPLLDKDAYPAAPFEPTIKDLARQVKAVDVTPARLPDDQAIDAVFVIGKGSQNNNEELRYALRNIAKHCPFVRDVYISGECPDWVDKSVVKHLQWPDKFRHAKDANIIDKLRHACEQKGIAKRILFCSDDQFQTHVCKWEDFFPRYLRPYTSEATWYAERKRVWHTRLRNTLERDKKRREAAGLDTSHIFYFEPHMWMQIDRDKFIEYAKWSDYEHSADTIIASGYFNFVNAEGHPHDKKYDHVFMGDGTKTLPKVTHIAYTDEGYKQAMVFLKELFPDRCRFEVGGQTSAKTTAAAPAQAARAVKTSFVAAPTVVRDAETVTVAPVVAINHAAIKAAIRSRIFGRISA